MATQEERRAKPRVEHFQVNDKDNGIKPVWFFAEDDDSVILSLILNISENGAAILLPKSAFVSAKTLRINSLYADQDHKFTLNKTADIKWADHAYSIDHVLLGLEFSDFEDACAVINQLVSESSSATPLRCTVEFHNSNQ